MEFKCKACSDSIITEAENKYVQCLKCKSYNFISINNENIDFYNSEDLVKNVYNATQDVKKAKFLRKIEKLNNFISKFKQNSFKTHVKYRKSVETIVHAKDVKVLEIGIGTGDFLYRLLEKGVNAYGIDISQLLVNNFSNKYPQYAHKVCLTEEFDDVVDVIYNSAVFEHVDHPEEFLQDIYNRLKPHGCLIVDNIPLVNDDIAGDKSISIEHDINFWKHIHMIIYSQKGAEIQFKKAGFAVVNKNLHDLYRFRVLSGHLEANFTIIEQIRDACIEFEHLPDLKQFQSICLQALFNSSKAVLGSYVLVKN
jgi:2-polyprenyl-3-methyl-5-hydroxy-6-metoxy-1,4-benzoquinol methylase